MAIRIPRYDGPQVRATNLPGVRHSDGGVTAEALGAGVGRALGEVGGLVNRIAQEQRQKADDAALMSFRNEMAAVESELLFDPERGVYARQGAEAFTAEQDVMPEWDARQSEAIGRLPARLQQRAAGLADGMRINARQGIMRHVLQQTEVYRDQQADAMVANATNAAVQHYMDPARLGEELANIEAGVVMKLRGAPDDAVSAAVARARSTALAAVVERTVQDDPFAGDAALQRYRGLLEADHVIALEAKLAPLKEAVELDGVAEAVMSGLPTTAVVPPARGTPPPELRAAIDAAAEKHGIPAAYLYAIAEQESSFNPAAVGVPTASGERAQGAFQFLPSTAAELGIDPMNVREAADAAARQFADRMRRKGPEFAIASHFAGEGGATAVLVNGRAKENPKTARYLAEVEGRALRWAGGGAQAAQAPRTPPSTLGEALSAVRADPRAANPLWRRKAEQRIRAEWAVVEADRIDGERVALERMRSAVVAAGASGASLASVLSPEDLALAQQKGWDETLDAKLQRQRRGELVRTDPVVYDRFARMLVSDPEKFASKQTIMDIWKAEGSLATEDLARLQGLWVEANQPEKAAAAQARKQAESGLVTEGLVKLGYVGDNLPSTTKEKAAAFRLAFAQARDAFRSTQGKEPTYDQDRIILGTVVQQFLADEAGRVQRTRALSGFGLTIPGEVRAAARARLREAGVENPTEAQVTAYLARLKAERAAQGNGGG